MRNLLLASVALAGLATAHQMKPAKAEIFDTAAIIALIKNTVAGFQQNANYTKAQTAAMQQIADASNTVNATNRRQLRSATIRDEHVVTPSHCEAVDNGQAIAVASGQNWVVAHSLTHLANRRQEGEPGTPAFEGEGQAASARALIHRNLYCSELEANEGLCRLSDRPNADLRISTMTGVQSYGTDRRDMNAAMDYAYTAVQPVPPNAIRGDLLRSAQGQEFKIWRDNFLAQKSAAQDVLTQAIARRAPTVTLTDAQKEQQRAQGMVVTDRGSWHLAATLEVNRRMAGTAWYQGLAHAPPAATMREIAFLSAFNSHILMKILEVNEQNAIVNAIHLAASVEDRTGRPQEAFRRMVTGSPTPQISSR